jgi:ribosome-binding protein aMBF1 (putative translation factor)
MSSPVSVLREARDATGLSRERVAAQLDPPISSKTLERWENGATVKRWRLQQLAEVYGVSLHSLSEKAAA